MALARLGAIALTVAGSAGVASADTRAVYEAPGFRMTVEIAANGDVRGDVSVKPGEYAIMKDGEAYVWGPDMNIPGVRVKFRERETFHATRENLKRFDANKIKPMDVSEFIERFSRVFNPVSQVRKEVKDFNEVIQSFLQQGGKQSADLTFVHPKPEAIQRRIVEEVKAETVLPIVPSQPVAAISLEDVRLKIGITHSELLIPMTTREQRGQVVKVLIEAGNPITQAEVISRMAEHGWAIAQSTISPLISNMVRDGLVIREGRGLRLPRFVAFELNER